MTNKTVFITGATSGIGRATALLLAKHGYSKLILTGRRADRLQELSSTIKQEYPGIEVYTAVMDVRDLGQVEACVNGIPEPFRHIDVLINNAGLAAGFSPIDEGNIEDWQRMIDTNVTGLLYVTRTLLPLMTQKGQAGHIVNVGSIAGREVYPNGNVYCCTKHAVDALTNGMRLDLLKYGLKVSQVRPGAVNTEFSTVRFHGDKERADKVYEGFEPLLAEDIAECILFILTAPKHVNVADLFVLPAAQGNGVIFNKR